MKYTLEVELVMNVIAKKSDKTSWVVGGGGLLGLGTGFFFLHYSAHFFVGCLVAGLGIGLIAAAILSKRIG